MNKWFQLLEWVNQGATYVTALPCFHGAKLRGECYKVVTRWLGFC